MTSQHSDFQDPIYTIKADLIESAITPNRLKGQNFLISPTTRDRIAALAKEQTCTQTIEIGPGTGILTAALVKTKKDLLALELEEGFVRLLKRRFQSFPGFHIIQTDAVKYLKSPDRTADNPRSLTCNLPYSISSPVLTCMAENPERYPEGVLLLQKEVVERVVAEPGDTQRGALSVLVQSQYNVRRAFNVKPSHFHPAPKVDSAVLVMKRNTSNYQFNWRRLQWFVHACFGQRRKTIYNNLKNYVEKSLLTRILQENGIEQTVRPQELDTHTFINLLKLLEEHRNDC